MPVTPEAGELITSLSDGSQPDDAGRFLLNRFLRMVNKHPQETLDTLFFDCYQAIPGLARFSQLRAFLVPHASFIYPGVAAYARRLQPIPGDDGCGRQALIAREARYLCRELVILVLQDPAVPPGERQKLHQALHLLRVAPEAPAGVSIRIRDVMDNISRYLDGSDILAELPDFQAVHFTNDELAMFHGLNIPLPAPEVESQLEAVLLPLRKREILQATRRFARSCPLPRLANQAIAVYITLGEVIPWHRHAFIKRLLVVSHQEAMVHACL
jgi:hypothetical protein